MVLYKHYLISTKITNYFDIYLTKILILTENYHSFTYWVGTNIIVISVLNTCLVSFGFRSTSDIINCNTLDMSARNQYVDDLIKIIAILTIM